MIYFDFMQISDTLSKRIRSHKFITSFPFNEAVQSYIFMI